jgi:hypothetical protein
MSAAGRIIARIARPSDILSANERDFALRKLGAPCNGGGKRNGPSLKGSSRERRPPGSIIVISWVQ